MCSEEQIKLFITGMYDSVFKCKTTSLFFLKTSCEFLLKNFEEEADEIKVCNFVTLGILVKALTQVCL